MIKPYYFRERYKIPSNRLKNYDYSTCGAYFVTVCTKGRVPYFGEIVAGKMVLNEMGIMLQQEILHLSNHFGYLVVDVFVIMPDHIHMVLFLVDDINNIVNNINADINANINTNVNMNMNANTNTNVRDVSQKRLYKNNVYINNYSRISPSKGSISNIIKLLKGFITRKIRALMANEIVIWQSNYHDHIVRNECELLSIRKYVEDNPLYWENNQNNGS